MDISTTIIGLILLALFVLPVFYAVKKGSASNKEILANFRAEAAKHGMNVTSHEQWNNRVIGLDQSNHKLLYSKTNEKHPKMILVDLTKVKKCETSEVNRQKKSANGGMEKVIDSIHLAFTFHDPKQAEVKLEIFDASNDLSLDGEVQLTEKWAKLLQPQTIPVRKSA